MYYVYILRSLIKSKEIYTGFTTKTPPVRLADHNAGLSIYTNKYKPWKLIWYCAFESEQKAKNFELYLKTASGIAFKNKRLV